MVELVPEPGRGWVACTAIPQLCLLLALCCTSVDMRGRTTLFLCVFAMVGALTGVRAALDVKGRCFCALKEGSGGSLSIHKVMIVC